MALNRKQQAFVSFYLVSWNASDAARKAGYSVRTADVQGHRLLGDARIAAAIKERVSELVMGADEALSRLSDLGRDAAKDGDKIRALELIGKANRLFVDRLEQSGELKVRVEYEDGDPQTPEAP